jgi:hypothetical protein
MRADVRVGTARSRAFAHPTLAARTRRLRSASQLAGAAGAEFRERPVGKPVELAGVGVALDRAVEALGLERLKSDAEFRKLVRRELGDGLFDVIDGGHGVRITCSPHGAKRNAGATL